MHAEFECGGHGSVATPERILASRHVGLYSIHRALKVYAAGGILLGPLLLSLIAHIEITPRQRDESNFNDVRKRYQLANVL